MVYSCNVDVGLLPYSHRQDRFDSIRSEVEAGRELMRRDLIDVFGSFKGYNVRSTGRRNEFMYLILNFLELRLSCVV